MAEPLKHSCPKHLAEGIISVQCGVNGPPGVPALERQLGLVRLLKCCLGLPERPGSWWDGIS